MYLAEFIGTFVFILSILCITSIAGLNSIQVAIAIGLSLCISILISLGLSNDAVAHLNPAVSLAMAVKGAISYPQGIQLIVVQLVSALVALFVFTGAKSA